MLQGRRPQRIADQIKSEVSQIVSYELRDKRIGFTTVTDVWVSPDLKQTRIYVSVLGSKEEARSTLEALNHAAGFVRHELGSRLRLRHAPQLSFHIDKSIEYGDRIERLIDQINRE